MTLRIALLGAQDPLGAAVISELEERDLAIGELIPLALDETDDFVGDQPVGHIDSFDWRRADVLVAAARAPAARRHIESAANQGCAVVCLGNDVDARAEHIVRIHNGLAVAAGKALSVIAGRAGLESVELFAALPVSMAGKSGVEELARQTQAVFTMEECEPETFPVRIAFNLIPQAGVPLEDGGMDLEKQCADDLRAHLGRADLPVMVTASWVPTFYGTSLALHGSVDSVLDRGALSDWLRQAAGVTVMDETVPGGAPTPYTESQEDDTIFVGRVRVDAITGRRFALWLVCDAIRLEAAQIVDRIENLIEKKAK